MLEILIIIAPLFLIIFLGAFLEHVKIADKNWSDVLNDFVLKIGFPALIFSALTKTTINLAEQLDLIIANSILLLSAFTLAYLIGKVAKLNSKNLRTLFITLAIGNVAYLGFPILVQISGEQVLNRASLVVAVYLFWLFTVGIGFLDYWQAGRKHVMKKILLNLIKNPLLISVFLGLIITGFQIPIPTIINQAISMMAASVTPLVLVVIGLFIGKSKIGELKSWLPVLLFCLSTLIIIPACFYYVVQIFGYSPNHFSTSIIEAAMPLAITPFALADMYKLNKDFIAKSIVLSTILSVITIPFWTSLV